LEIWFKQEALSEKKVMTRLQFHGRVFFPLKFCRRFSLDLHFVFWHFGVEVTLLTGYEAVTAVVTERILKVNGRFGGTYGLYLQHDSYDS
jgi:hypothetical protein